MQAEYTAAAARPPACACGCRWAQPVREKEVLVVTRQAAFTISVPLVRCAAPTGAAPAGCGAVRHAKAADLGCFAPTYSAWDLGVAKEGYKPLWIEDGLLQLCDKLHYGRNHAAMHCLATALWEVLAGDGASETPGRNAFKTALTDVAMVSAQLCEGDIC
jgi:hypothetical protein